MIEIVADISSLKRNAIGSITGRIFLRGPTGDFPTNQWSDFPVVVLGWWITGLTSVAVSDARSFQGLFMDGPFAFVVKRGASTSGQIAWGPHGNEISIGVVDIEALLELAVDTGRRVAEACRAQDWNSSDLDDLERAIAQSERKARS